MKKSHGLVSVIFALIGNWTVTMLKGIAFLISWSGAMFSETIHSFADTLNQSFLLVGIRRASKWANKNFVYGFGKERFFRAVISACGIFFIGAGITVYHGLQSLFADHEIITTRVTFAVLGLSFIIESITFGIAIRELIHSNPRKKFFNLFINGDPVTLAVVYEDGIALLWVIVAFISIWIANITGKGIRDSIGSLVIWVMLWIMAIILINKNREFLIEKAIPKEVQEEIIEMLEGEEIIEKVLDFKSWILDIGKYRIKCEIECNGTGLLKTIGRDNFLKKEYEKIKDNYQDFLEFCIDYTRRVPRVIWAHIDDIEKRIKEKFPQIKHIDIEIN